MSERVSGDGRIRYLDGLRGVAVGLVVLFHYYGPVYAGLLPYGARYAAYPIIAQGAAGVELFFLISGFVILMTLEKCRSFGDFLHRRWLRLFPAMALATVLLLAFNQLGLTGPDSGTSFIDALPGLTFIEPTFYKTFLRLNLHSLDGVFWSLYVEAAFYVVFGTLYFQLGAKRAIPALVAIWLAVVAARALNIGRIVEPFEWAGFQWFGWFASGALFYRGLKESQFFWAAVAVGLIAVILYSNRYVGVPLPMRVMLLAMVFLFAAAQRYQPLQRGLASRTPLFAGTISYPLYLLHNHIGVSLLEAMHGGPLLGLIPLLLVVPASWLCVRYFEPSVKQLLRPKLQAVSPLPARAPAAEVPEA